MAGKTFESRNSKFDRNRNISQLLQFSTIDFRLLSFFPPTADSMMIVPDMGEKMTGKTFESRN